MRVLEVTEVFARTISDKSGNRLTSSQWCHITVIGDSGFGFSLTGYTIVQHVPQTNLSFRDPVRVQIIHDMLNCHFTDKCIDRVLSSKRCHIVVVGYASFSIRLGSYSEVLDVRQTNLNLGYLVWVSKVIHVAGRGIADKGINRLLSGQGRHVAVIGYGGFGLSLCSYGEVCYVP
ncbi:hypothetical protein D3C86_1277970 [compost metagenome]